MKINVQKRSNVTAMKCTIRMSIKITFQTAQLCHQIQSHYTTPSAQAMRCNRPKRTIYYASIAYVYVDNIPSNVINYHKLTQTRCKSPTTNYTNAIDLTDIKIFQIGNSEWCHRCKNISKLIYSNPTSIYGRRLNTSMSTWPHLSGH